MCVHISDVTSTRTITEINLLMTAGNTYQPRSDQCDLFCEFRAGYISEEEWTGRRQCKDNARAAKVTDKKGLLKIMRTVDTLTADVKHHNTVVCCEHWPCFIKQV